MGAPENPQALADFPEGSAGQNPKRLEICRTGAPSVGESVSKLGTSGGTVPLQIRQRCRICLHSGRWADAREPDRGCLAVVMGCCGYERAQTKRHRALRGPDSSHRRQKDPGTILVRRRTHGKARAEKCGVEMGPGGGPSPQKWGEGSLMVPLRGGERTM